MRESALQDTLPPLAVLCLEPTPNALWAGTASGLKMYRSVRVVGAVYLPEEAITAVIAPTSTVYFATRRSWGIYQLPLGGRPEPLPLPEVMHAGYVQVHALALWNNQLAIATSFGLYRYDFNARQPELVYNTPSIRYLIAAETRLWGFGSEIVAFDREYRVVERQAAQVPIAPVWEESRFWWASAGRGTITLHSYTPTTRRIRQSRFRMDEATQVVSSRLQATALARHRLGWYVGLSVRESPQIRRGAVVQVRFADYRSELVWSGSPVNALASWGKLIVGTDTGLQALDVP